MESEELKSIIQLLKYSLLIQMKQIDIMDKQRKFMGAELGRKRAGKKTKTGMSASQLSDFAAQPAHKSRMFPAKKKSYFKQ